MMKAKKKNDYSEMYAIEIGNAYFIVALLVALIGFVTPLISFPVGVFGFVVVVIWLGFNIKRTSSLDHIGRLIMAIFLLIASWCLLYYIGYIFGLFFGIIPCPSCFA